MTRNLAALPLLALLAACGTPQEQCIGRQTRELRNVEELLGEVEGNLARGYAWEERQISRTVLRECPVTVAGPDGAPVVIARPCERDVLDTERFRVAIDPAAEARKRDGLVERRAALVKQAKAGVEACKAAYPETRR